MIARWMVRFYDEPRGRFLCLLGSFFIVPVLRRLEKDVERTARLLQSQQMLLGRLELTQDLITMEWQGKRRKKVKE